MAFSAADAVKLAADLPALLDLYATFTATVAATKGESPTARDFDVIAALLPKLRTLAIQVEAQLATTAA
jgi:hypothetical protein